MTQLTEEKRLSLWQRYIKSDLAVALTIWIPIVIWEYRFNGIKIINSLIEGNRGIIYGTLTSLNGTLLGFIIASVSIVIGYINLPRFTSVRQSLRYPDFGHFFIQSIRFLGLATFMSLLGLIIDKDKSSKDFVFSLEILCLITVLLSISRFAIVFEGMINAVFQTEERTPIPTTFSIREKQSV